MKEILNLHIVRDRLNTERIRQSNAHSVSFHNENKLKTLTYSILIDYNQFYYLDLSIPDCCIPQKSVLQRYHEPRRQSNRHR